ncbi:hypothetical protein DKG34_06480 [Streptomyces sp. NWU49]|nr:hypothetical protein DKG34_06480 [Streptomyces sp. NWU49]
MPRGSSRAWNTSASAGQPGGGHPRTRPDHLGGDKAYSSRRNRRHLRQGQIKRALPEPEESRAVATGSDERAYVFRGAVVASVRLRS